MRLKTIHARTMQEAMELVRDQMGAEAIIVATHEDEGTRGVRVTAASDSDDRDIPEAERAVTFESLQMIGNSLDDHGTPPQLTDRLLLAFFRLLFHDIIVFFQLQGPGLRWIVECLLKVSLQMCHCILS